jgi:hypothetical protein
MKWLTEDALLHCDHSLGIVQIAPSQDLVRISGRAVLVFPDPVGKPIVGCPNSAIPSHPCLTTLVVSAGYSDLIRIEGRAVCLDKITGWTDGTPPGVVTYTVANPGQDLVDERRG